MNQDQFAGLCRQLSGKFKVCWGNCTGNPLTVAAGNHDLLAGRMRERYGVSREEAARQLRALHDRDLVSGKVLNAPATRSFKLYLIER